PSAVETQECHRSSYLAWEQRLGESEGKALRKDPMNVNESNLAVSQEPDKKCEFREDQEGKQQLPLPRCQFCGNSSITTQGFLATNWKISETLDRHPCPVRRIVAERMVRHEHLDFGETRQFLREIQDESGF